MMEGGRARFPVNLSVRQDEYRLVLQRVSDAEEEKTPKEVNLRLNATLPVNTFQTKSLSVEFQQ